MAAAASNGEQWKCSDRDCDSGQTFLDRNEFGRMVISDFFGRNKTTTKAIPGDVWHLQCRKGYQRSKYAADNGTPGDHLAFFLGHLRAQITRIGLWRPQATFTVQLAKPAKARLSEYHAHLRRNGGNVDDALAHVAVAPKTGKRAKALSSTLADCVDPRHAEKIDADFAGEHRSLPFISTIIFPWIETEFACGRMVRMPPIEFLINEPIAGESITKPQENHARWLAHLDGISYNSTSTQQLTSNSGSKRKADDEESSPEAKRPKVMLRIPSTRLRPSPAPISPTTMEAASILMSMRNSDKIKELPLYVPPLPIVRSIEEASKSPIYRPLSPVYHRRRNEVKPIMARGMVFAAAKPPKTPDYDTDDDESSEYESEDE